MCQGHTSGWYHPHRDSDPIRAPRTTPDPIGVFEESGELSLDKSLELFERGIKLAKECQKRIEDAEQKIQVLLRDTGGEPALEEFNESSAEVSS